MEIKELISYFINESTGIMEVNFKTFNDKDDEIRIDQIDLDEVLNFGYNFTKINEDLSSDENDEDFDLFSDFDEDLDENEIVSFLNEYYLIFPDRVPKKTIY